MKIAVLAVQGAFIEHEKKYRTAKKRKPARGF